MWLFIYKIQGVMLEFYNIDIFWMRISPVFKKIAMAVGWISAILSEFYPFSRYAIAPGRSWNTKASPVCRRSTYKKRIFIKKRMCW